MLPLVHPVLVKACYGRSLVSCFSIRFRVAMRLGKFPGPQWQRVPFRKEYYQQVVHGEDMLSLRFIGCELVSFKVMQATLQGTSYSLQGELNGAYSFQNSTCLFVGQSH